MKKIKLTDVKAGMWIETNDGQITEVNHTDDRQISVDRLDGDVFDPHTGLSKIDEDTQIVLVHERNGQTYSVEYIEV
jgi:hypothetical protein